MKKGSYSEKQKPQLKFTIRNYTDYLEPGVSPAFVI